MLAQCNYSAQQAACHETSIACKPHVCCCLSGLCHRAVLLQEAKSETVSQQRMALLMPRSSAAAAGRPRADVVIHVKAGNGFKEVRMLPLDPPTVSCCWCSCCQLCKPSGWRLLGVA